MMNLLKIKFSCRSETGLVRKNNEDNFFCNGEILTQEKISLNGIAASPCVFAVCDGMGGEAHGELASLTAVKVLQENLEKIKSAALSNNLDRAVQDFISEANNKICKIMRENSFRMGTTIALAVISNNFIRAYNIGDSRIYKFQDGILSQLSVDHTVAQQKIKMKLITKEQGKHDKSRHVLTRCLGIYEDEMILTPHIISPLPVNKNLKILLCSDGLTEMISDSEIQEILCVSKNISQASDALVETALKNGGHDNVTCLIISFQD